jgi:Aspartyl/Asparaginyl beta-hydroxylase
MSHMEILGKINTARASLLLSCMPKIWDQVTFRQEHPLSPHKQTRSVYLRWPKAFNARAALYALDYEDKPAIVHPAFKTLVEDCEELIGEPAVRAVFVSLEPGGFIAPHIDQGPFASVTDRYHLCLSTNKYSILAVEEERLNLLPGQLCFFNKHRTHSAANNGKTPRIHLILDIMK